MGMKMIINLFTCKTAVCKTAALKTAVQKMRNAKDSEASGERDASRF